MSTPLEGSIAKWEAIVAGHGQDRGIANCALCQAYLTSRGYEACHECPVFKRTGETGCDATPYEAWYHHQSQEHDGIGQVVVDCPDCARLARAELEFLKSLQ